MYKNNILIWITLTVVLDSTPVNEHLIIFQVFVCPCVVELLFGLQSNM